MATAAPHADPAPRVGREPDIHLHCPVLDGVYRSVGDEMRTYVEVAAPTDDELHAPMLTLFSRLMKLLTRRGVLVEEMGQAWLAESDADGDEACTLRPQQAAVITCCIVFGPTIAEPARCRPAGDGHHLV